MSEAASMEARGAPGAIQMSASTLALLEQHAARSSNHSSGKQSQNDTLIHRILSAVVVCRGDAGGGDLSPGEAVRSCLGAAELVVEFSSCLDS